MRTEQIEFHFEDGELVAPASHLYKRFIYSLMKKTVSFGETPVIHEFFAEVVKDALKYDDVFKKTPKQFQEEVLDLLELPYETIYEMMLDKPYPCKEEEVPKLRLVK